MNTFEFLNVFFYNTKPGADLPPPSTQIVFLMPIKSKELIQMLQKSQDRHKISFAFEFDNKNIKKVFGQICPPYN